MSRIPVSLFSSTLLFRSSHLARTCTCTPHTSTTFFSSTSSSSFVFSSSYYSFSFSLKSLTSPELTRPRYLTSKVEKEIKPAPPSSSSSRPSENFPSFPSEILDFLHPKQTSQTNLDVSHIPPSERVSDAFPPLPTTPPKMKGISFDVIYEILKNLKVPLISFSSLSLSLSLSLCVCVQL